MPAENWDHDSFEAMRAERRGLAEQMVEVRQSLFSENRTRNQVDDQMTRLAELVASHFCHEEEGGYLSDVLERAPRLTSQAVHLQEQHETLLEEIEKLRLLVHSGMESEAWWARIETDFHRFSSRLMEHEQAENRLLLQAYDDDVGTSD